MYFTETNSDLYFCSELLVDALLNIHSSYLICWLFECLSMQRYKILGLLRWTVGFHLFSQLHLSYFV